MSQQNKPGCGLELAAMGILIVAALVWCVVSLIMAAVMLAILR